jgi:hypothetical protein
MFFGNIIILIGVIDKSSHHLSFDTHLAQDCHRAVTQQLKNRVEKELCKNKEKNQFERVNVSFLSLAFGRYVGLLLTFCSYKKLAISKH